MQEQGEGFLTTAPGVPNPPHKSGMKSRLYRRFLEFASPAAIGGGGRKVNVKMAKDKYYGKTLRKNFARY